MKTGYEGERIVGTAELKRLLRDHLSLIQKVIGSALIVAWAFHFYLPLEFVAEATFKTVAPAQEKYSPFKDILALQGFGSQDVPSSAILQSDMLLKQVTHRLGLQIFVQERSRWEKMIDHLISHLRFFLGKEGVDRSSFTFSEVVYEEEKGAHFWVSIEGKDHYRLYTAQGDDLGSYALGEKFCVSLGPYKLQGLLVSFPQQLKVKKRYLATVTPYRAITGLLRKSLKVARHKADPSVLNLSFSYQERHLAARILNEIMSSYERSIHRENAEKIQWQLDYLSQREKQLIDAWDCDLAEYERYLEKNLASHGYLNCAQEIDVLSSSQTLFTNQLFDIDLELKRLGFPGDFSSCPLYLQQKPSEEKQEASPEELLANIDLEEKRLESSFLSPSDGTLTLEAAKNLYIHYQNQRDGVEVKQVQQRALLDKMGEDHLDISALTSVLSDPIAQEIVHKAAHIAVQLQDSDNRSLRERELLRETLSVQKRFICEHLERSLEVDALQLSLLETKIASLQHLMQTRLKKEKDLIEHKIEEITHKMQGVPNRWRKENLLSLKKETGLKLLETIGQLVEGRNIDLNLCEAGVKSLDAAIAPLSPFPRSPLRDSLAFALLCGIVTYMILVGKALKEGFPLTKDALTMMGLTAVGEVPLTLSRSVEGLSKEMIDLLRQLHGRMGSKKSVSLWIHPQGPDLSFHVAELMALAGKRVLLIDYLTASPSGACGLYHYLRGSTLQIHPTSHPGVDRIYSGGWGRYFPELLKTEKFSLLIEEMKGLYDQIVISTEASITSFGFIAPVLTCSDHVVVTTYQERAQDVKPLLEWAQEESSHKLSFLICEA